MMREEEGWRCTRVRNRTRQLVRGGGELRRREEKAKNKKNDKVQAFNYADIMLRECSFAAE
jgi:hypothetical protein